MMDWERRAALGSPPRKRKRATFNMLTLAEHTRIWQNTDELSMTDVRVLFFLLDVVDHDGYSVATIPQIAEALKRCESNISASLKKLITTGRLERCGRSGFRISYSVLSPKGGLEVVQPRRLDDKRAS